MKLITKIIVLFIASAGGLIAADYFIAGFSITHDPVQFLILSGLFTVLQFFLKPLLRLLFLPLIFITLGLFTLVINALLLFALDIWSLNLTIEGLTPLFIATLIITAAHFVATLLWHPTAA
jgi:putative membrane protein